MGRTLEDMDIHSPSLRNVPKSKTAESLNELLEEKVVLESTLNELNIILERHGVGLRHPPWLETDHTRYVYPVD
jgi:hypothetical protein